MRSDDETDGSKLEVANSIIHATRQVLFEEHPADGLDRFGIVLSRETLAKLKSNEPSQPAIIRPSPKR